MKKTAVALSVAFAAGLTTSTLALANGFNAFLMTGYK